PHGTRRRVDHHGEQRGPGDGGAHSSFPRGPLPPARRRDASAAAASRARHGCGSARGAPPPPRPGRKRPAPQRPPARPLGPAPAAQAALGTYAWPGNVRELSNTMERVALLVDAPVVTAAMLDLSSEAGTVEPPLAPASSSRALEVTLGAVERTRLLEALDDTF